MRKQVNDKMIKEAQTGDEWAREKIIEDGKPFIAKVGSNVCKRYLEWGVDEELSIALLAYNEAIDSYDSSGKTSFTSFAYQVIHRRLVDYFRKEAKEKHASLIPIDPENSEFSKGERDVSITNFENEEKQADLSETVAVFNTKLDGYGITFKDLVSCSPKHRDTRENLMQAAKYLQNDQELLEQLTERKRLPVKELCKGTGYSRKVIEKGRKYIIALTLILTEPELSGLKHFTTFPQ